MTTFLGNAIDMGISGSHIVSEPATEFFVYAALMFIVMGIFILMAMNYTYVDERAFERTATPTEIDEHELPDKRSALEPRMTAPTAPTPTPSQNGGIDDHKEV